MKYSYEFKLKCADMYNQGLYMEPPDGVKATTFHRLIRVWARTIEACGSDALKHNNFNKDWSAEKRYELVECVRVFLTVSIKFNTAIKNALACCFTAHRSVIYFHFKISFTILFEKILP